MAHIKTQRKTEITVPNWVIALAVVVALIIVAAVLLVKYYPAIILWLR